MSEWDCAMMRMALEEAERAEADGEVPVGAVLAKGGDVIAKGHNRSISLADPSAHAEIQVLRAAGKKTNNYRLPDTTLYVTLEPCLMCAGALYWAQVTRIVYGATDLKRGFSLFPSSPLHPATAVTKGILEMECAALLSDFFKRKRKDIIKPLSTSDTSPCTIPHIVQLFREFPDK